MQHFRSLRGVQVQNAWLSIGSFDGVHLGHQEILRRLTSGAHALGAPAVVLTFYPHPAVVLGKRKRAYYLTTPDEQAEILRGLAVDLLITHPFTREVAAQSARQFLMGLNEHLNLAQLWVGHDFAMGFNREGDVPALRLLGESLGFQVKTIPPVTLDGEPVSSSRIRALLAEGDLAQANRMLGRSYSLTGRVDRGADRSHALGVPTANLSISAERVLLKTGVYSCWARIRNERWEAVTRIGFRPAFSSSDEAPIVETHLLDFDDELYGQDLHLDFVARLRGERRFPDPQAQAAQIHTDIAQARLRLKRKDRQV